MRLQFTCSKTSGVPLDMCPTVATTQSSSALSAKLIRINAILLRPVRLHPIVLIFDTVNYLVHVKL